MSKPQSLASQAPVTSRRIEHWIGGRPDAGSGDRSGPVFDPARGTEVARVLFAETADVERAVEAARGAFVGWRRTPAARRSQVLFAFREILERHREELALLISREHGKTRPDALGEIQRGVEVVEFACGVPHLLKGEISASVATGVDTVALREPLGVVAGITPFNFPAMVPMWMLVPAIACGNAFVLKPSERDPSAAVRLAELFGEAGLPEGVLNVVNGDRVTVETLLEDPGIDAVSFVGSTPVARTIYEQGSARGKRVQALGGAKNHMVVLPDADLELAADAAVSAGYGSAGERCMAISVVVAVGAAADPLVAAIRDRAAALRVGPAEDPASEMGPLVTAEHRDRVRRYIDIGVAEGAELILDGRPISVPACDDGFFLGPTLFDRVGAEMTIYRDEIFGPVLSVVRTESYEEAVTLINRNPWANGTAVFTNDGGAARRFQEEIEVGMVGINVPIPVPVGYHSFAGWRESLFGTHGVYGPEGIHFYTRPKVITSRWPDPAHRGVDLGFPRSR